MRVVPVDAERGPTSVGLRARFVGILTSPRETFAALAVRPTWFDMLAIVLAIWLVCTGAFLSTAIGRQAMVDRQERLFETFTGQPPTDAEYAALQRRARFSPQIAAVQILVGAPILTAMLAGVLFAIFTVGLGGEASFKQVFAVAVHAGAVIAVQQMVVTPLNYVRESMASVTNLAVWLPMLDESSLAARFLGTIDLFLLWWVIVLGIGLAVLYGRRTPPIVLSLLATYGVIAVLVAAVLASRGGS